ncbi:MAG TPA: hypothetical protein VH834_05415 [Solirubrobacteraceae bacterium]
MLATLACAPAGARAVEPVRITAPAADSLRTSTVVTVVVRTAGAAPRLRVTTDARGNSPHDVTARFHRVGRGRYVARLRVGRDLRFGVNHVFAEARAKPTGADSRRFTIARPGLSTLTVRRVEHGRAEHPPLDIAVRGPRRATVRARLNGRAVREEFKPNGNGRWRGTFGVKDGLRFGPNVLVVTAFAGNRYQRFRIAADVTHDRPLADAGLDRMARAGRAVRLDGRATRAAPGARGLALRWRIVSRPKRSHARLEGATGTRPLLHTDVNGHYRIELVATHRRGRASTAQTPPAAVDTADVTVTPNVLPSGVPVQTLATQNGSLGISVGQDFYAMPAGSAVQLLELDRQTLDKTTAKNTGYAPGQEQALLTEVNSLGPDTIAIMTGDGGAAYNATAEVQQAITKIGGKLDGASQAIGVISELTNGHGGWSVIGVPGIPSGQAYQLIGLQQSAGNAVGSMSGAFRSDSGGDPADLRYAFNWASEYHPFDTSQSTTPTGNTMAVDEQDYTSWNLPFPGRTGTVGFQLLWFDADTLTLRESQTYDADPNSSYDDVRTLSPAPGTGACSQPQPPAWCHGMWGLRDELRKINSDPKPGLLFINTIGTVPSLYYQAVKNKSDGNDVRGDVMARVTALLEQFGANRFAFMGLGRNGATGTTPGGYSLVGVTGLRYVKGPNAGAELSTRLNPGTTARLTGLLTRSRQGVLQAGATKAPAAAPDPSSILPGIQAILAQPPQPFTPWSQMSQQEQNWQIDLAGRLSPPLAVDKTTIGIRANYWQAANDDFGTMSGQLGEEGSACLGPPTNPTACSPDELNYAIGLSKEFAAVGAVRDHIGEKGDLWGVFDTAFLSGSYDIQSVWGHINSLYAPPKSSATSGPSALGILSGVLGLAGGIGGFALPEGGEGLAVAADLAASVVDVIEASTTDEDSGESLLDPYGFHSTVADLADDLSHALTQTKFALDRVADLIVSDAGRLSAAAAVANKPSIDGGWDLSLVSTQLERRLQQTMSQFMWMTMMQPVLATYECAREDEADVTSHNPAAVLATNINYPEWEPRGTSSWNLYPTWLMLANRNHFGWPELAPKNVTNILFGTPGDGDLTPDSGIGFIPEYLFGRAIAGGGDPIPDPDLDRNVFPVSPGLVHKNMGMGFQEEDENGLSHRNTWSAYTPSCGHGVRLIWSDPDPRKPDSPYANP